MLWERQSEPAGFKCDCGGWVRYTRNGWTMFGGAMGGGDLFRENTTYTCSQCGKSHGSQFGLHPKHGKDVTPSERYRR